MSSPLARFSTSLVADCLDDVGLTNQVVSPALRQLVAPAGVTFAGRARTLLWRVLPPADQFASVPREQAAKALAWRDAWNLQSGDVVVIGCDGGPTDAALQGDLVALYYARLGVVGVLADGYIRDLDPIAKIGLGVIARGTSPQNGRGRLARVGVGSPIEIGGVTVHEGDFVLADTDGCVIVPRDLADGDEFPRRVEQAHEDEEGSAAMLREGRSLSETYARYGRL